MNRVLSALVSIVMISAFGFSATAAEAIKGAPPTGAGVDIHGACKADATKLCPGLEAGTGLFKCMQEKDAQISSECKSMMAQGHAKMKAAKDACEADVMKFCKDVKMGGGRIIKCLKSHEGELTTECKAVQAKH